MGIRFAAALLLGTLASGFDTTRLAAQASLSVTEIPLNGHINVDIAAHLHTALNDGKPHILRINSSGGEDLPALAIAADIARNHVAVVVDGLCAGPCANYIFLAALRRTVQPGGLVIFSGSAMSRTAMVPVQRSNELNGDYAKTAQQEKQLLASARLSSALLLEPQLRLQTDCYSLTSHDRFGKAYINYQARSIGWIPSRAYLERAGVKLTGFWPKSDGQFRATLGNAFPGGVRGSIAFAGTDNPSPAAALFARLGSIKECESGLPGNHRP